MIGIIVNNKALVLPPNLKIRVELNSTLFDTEEGIPASIVWYFNIPADGNEEALNYANYVEAAGKYRIVPASLTYFGMPLFSCKLVVKGANNRTFRIGMTLDQFTEDYQDKLITELSWETENIGGTPFSENNVVQFCTDVATKTKVRDYEFPQLYAPKWYGNDNSNNESFTGFLNDLEVDTFKVNTDEDNGNSLLPCPKFLSVLKKIYADDNFTLTGSVLDDDRIEELIILNNYSLDGLFALFSMLSSTTGTQSVPKSTITQVYYDDIASGDNKDDSNCYFEGGYKAISNKKYNIISEVELHIDNISTPQATSPITLYIYKNDVEIASEEIQWKDASRVNSDPDSNVKHTISLDDLDLIADDVIKIKFQNIVNSSTDIVDGYLSVGVASKGTTNTYADNINVANHLPEISNNDFISAFRKSFGFALFYDFSKRSVEIDFLNDVLASNKYLDLTHALIKESEDIEVREKRNYYYSFDSSDDIKTYSQYEYLGEFKSVHALPTPEKLNVVAKVINQNSIYLYHVTDENEYIWEFYSRCENSYKTGTSNILEVTPSIQIPKMSEYQELYLPEINFEAQSKAFNQSVTPTDKLQLLLYRGLKNFNTQFAMTYASTMQYIRYGDFLWDGSLLWNNYRGLFYTYHEGWTNFVKKSETITMKFNLDLEDIINIMVLFKPQPNVPVEDRIRKIRVENTTYIPRKISFELSMTGQTYGEFELEKKGYDSQL